MVEFDREAFIAISLIVCYMCGLLGDYLGCKRGFASGKLSGAFKAREEGKKWGYAEGYNSARVRAWTNIIVTGNQVGLFINGKRAHPTLDVDSRSSGAKTIGVWWLDGHTRDGFVSRDEFEEDSALRMYGKDLNKILKKLEDEPYGQAPLQI